MLLCQIDVNHPPVISAMFLNSLFFILCFPDRVISSSDKQDRKCCSACRVTFHSGLSSWLEWKCYDLFCVVIGIAKGKGNDKAGKHDWVIFQ